MGDIGEVLDVIALAGGFPELFFGLGIVARSIEGFSEASRKLDVR